MTHPQFKIQRLIDVFNLQQQLLLKVPSNALVFTNADMVLTQGGVEKSVNEILADGTLMPFYFVTRSYGKGIAGLLTYWYERGHEDGYEEGTDEHRDPEPSAAYEDERQR